MKSIGILLCVLLLSLGNGCESGAYGRRADTMYLQTANQQLVYDLNSPSEKYYLPYSLEEISGLSYKNPNKLLAVDDEKGKVFEYDLDKREVTHTIIFHNPGDFEGVELVKNQIYVLRSDGDIFEFPYVEEKSVKPVKYETSLSRANDTEGFGYDPMANQLLIACKEKGEIGKKDVKGKAIYGFDLKKMELNKKPLLVISEKKLKDFWKLNGSDFEKNRINFKPSAIAFHPIQKVYYVLSSSGKLLIVVDKNDEILATYPLSSKLLYQPEGLCFSSTGDMYISSEGNGGRGYILKYKMIHK